MARRKRIDPVDAPIDGDPVKDAVFGKDPSKHYAYIHPEDLGVARSRGMLKTERVAGGPYSNADENTEGDIRVGDMVLMELPQAKKDAIDSAQRRNFAARMSNERRDIDAHIKKHGGEFSVTQGA